MPPAPESPRQPNLPSQLLAAAVTAFRALVATVQGTEDPGNRLNQVAGSLGEVATMFERVATSTAAFEQQFNQQVSTNAQVQRQINQQATINSQLDSRNQDTAKNLSNLKAEINSNNQEMARELNSMRQAVQTLQAQATTGDQPSGNASRKPLCESRSVANLKH